MSGANDTADVPIKSPSAADEFWQGVRDELPLMFGVIPFGLVFGVIGIESGLTSLQTILCHQSFLAVLAKLSLLNYGLVVFRLSF